MENSGGYQCLFEGGNYGTMLQYHTLVSRQWDLERLSITAVQIFLERCEAGGWNAQPAMGNRFGLGG